MLDAAMNTGLNRRHAHRFGRQEAGLGTYLVAWSAGGVPVGCGEVRWDGCEDAGVRARFPGCPELNALSVWPVEQRSRGAGTALVRAAEAETLRRGLPWIGLGVGDENTRAAALYLRLGYAETGCRYTGRWVAIDGDGVAHDESEATRFLVNLLVTPAGHRADARACGSSSTPGTTGSGGWG